MHYTLFHVFSHSFHYTFSQSICPLIFLGGLSYRESNNENPCPRYLWKCLRPHLYCRKTSQISPYTTVNVSLPDSFRKNAVRSAIFNISISGDQFLEIKSSDNSCRANADNLTEDGTEIHFLNKATAPSGRSTR
jgi:hypothetical protein